MRPESWLSGQQIFTDQIATLPIILEWNFTSLCNVIDYEKAFDSLDRQNLWRQLLHFEVPQKIVDIIRNTYEGMTCQFFYGQQVTDLLFSMYSILLYPIVFNCVRFGKDCTNSG